MLFISPATLLDRPDPLPPRSDTNLPTVIATTTILLTLALTTFVLRIWVRTKHMNLLGWDDAAITLAMVLTLACYGVNLTISVWTKGQHTWYIGLEALAKVAHVSFAFVILWLWAVSVIKISVCLMLLRIKSRSRNWFCGLWGLIGLIVCLSVAITICYLLQCKPIEANWDFKYLLEQGHCWTLDQFLSFTYAFSSESLIIPQSQTCTNVARHLRPHRCDLRPTPGRLHLADQPTAAREDNAVHSHGTRSFGIVLRNNEDGHA